jgi:hypothetical protein
MDEHKKNNMKENNNERSSLPTNRGDTTVDPVSDDFFFNDRSTSFCFNIL